MWLKHEPHGPRGTRHLHLYPFPPSVRDSGQHMDTGIFISTKHWYGLLNSVGLRKQCCCTIVANFGIGTLQVHLTHSSSRSSTCQQGATQWGSQAVPSTFDDNFICHNLYPDVSARPCANFTVDTVFLAGSIGDFIVPNFYHQQVEFRFLCENSGIEVPRSISFNIFWSWTRIFGYVLDNVHHGVPFHERGYTILLNTRMYPGLARCLKT